MKKIFNFIRSFIFSILFILSTSMLFSSVLISSIFGTKKNVRMFAGLWAKSVVWLLKITCGITYEIQGLENLPKNEEKYIVVSKHQSTWETYFLYYFFKNYASFVLKKELLKIPFFGYGLKKTGHIAIERGAGLSSIKKTVKEAKEKIDENRKVVIFPQGTRVPIEKSTEEYPYKVGFYAIIKDLKTDIVPIALNSGKFWAKGQFIKNPGKIIIKILPIIKYDEISKLKKDKAIKYIENVIETECSKLLL